MKTKIIDYLKTHPLEVIEKLHLSVRITQGVLITAAAFIYMFENILPDGSIPVWLESVFSVGFALAIVIGIQDAIRGGYTQGKIDGYKQAKDASMKC